MDRSPYVVNLTDLAGQRFGRLLVIEYAGSVTVGSNHKKATWRCTCDCGTEVVALAQTLRAGKKSSCGCLLKESRAKNAAKARAKFEPKSGPENHRWNHDLDPETRAITRKTERDREWRSTVLARDDYTCAVCGQRGGALHAHHLRSFRYHPEGRYDPDNGVTMCRDHHLDFHKVYGRKDFTPENFKEYQQLNRPCE